MTWWGEGGRGHYEYHSYRVGWKDFDHVVYFIPKMALAGCGSWLTLKMGSTIARPADAFLLLRKPSGQLVSQREWGVPTSRNGTLHFQWLVFPPTYKIICKISSMYVVIEIDVDVAYQKLCILSLTHTFQIYTHMFLGLMKCLQFNGHYDSLITSRSSFDCNFPSLYNTCIFNQPYEILLKIS